jgi:hypothetical protein
LVEAVGICSFPDDMTLQSQRGPRQRVAVLGRFSFVSRA